MFEDSLKELHELNAIRSEKTLALAKVIYKEVKALALKFENLPLGSPHISINWDRAITIDDEVFYPADLEDEINE